MDWNHCEDCENRENCDLVDDVNFCDNCKHYLDCPLVNVFCDDCHAIECNNGYEPKYMDEDDYDD